MWNGASVRARRLPRPRPAPDSRATDRLLRGRRPKKLHVRRGHGRHRGLVPCHLGRGRRPVLMFSSRLRMPLLLLGIVSLLVLPLMPEVGFLQAHVAVAMPRRRALELAAVAARRAVRLPGPVPAPRQRERVRRQVAERPAHRDLRPPRPAPVVQRQEGFLPVA